MRDTYSISEYTKKTLKYIGNEIEDNELKNNIIKFDKNFELNKNKIKKLYIILYEKIIKLIKDNIIINNYLIENCNWIIKSHDKPICYYNYQKKENITYEEYEEKYNLRNIILNEYNYINYIREYSTLNNNKILKILNIFQNGYFIDLNIKLYVENNINNCNIYKFEHLELYYFYKDENDIDDTIYNIYIITKLLYEKKKIKLYYFDTPLNKTLDNKNKYISSKNVNSGSSSKNEIIIWRREELLKVLFHELIHYLELDIKHENNLKYIIRNKIGKYNYPILLNETITEIFAQFLHSIYISIILYKKHSLNYVFDRFKYIYIYEMIYSWYQFSKIMNFFNIKKYNENTLLNFNQTTNCYSYYIIKCILYNNIFDIIFSFNYINKLINNDKCNCDIYNCLPIIDIIKLNINNINNIDNIIKKINLNDSSLRMVLFSLKNY